MPWLVGKKDTVPGRAINLSQRKRSKRSRNRLVSRTELSLAGAWAPFWGVILEGLRRTVADAKEIGCYLVLSRQRREDAARHICTDSVASAKGDSG